MLKFSLLDTLLFKLKQSHVEHSKYSMGQNVNMFCLNLLVFFLQYCKRKKNLSNFQFNDENFTKISQEFFEDELILGKLRNVT